MEGLTSWREGRGMWIGGTMEVEYAFRHHRHEIQPNQCSSFLVKHIRAPVHLVWSLVRTFDQPQRYKPFVHSCTVTGDITVGSIRNVNVKSGLPATASEERLEILDDNEHIFSVRFLGGDHRLQARVLVEKQQKLLSTIKQLEELVALTLERVQWKQLQTKCMKESRNYSSVITLHPEILDGRPGTLVIESYVVDVPEGNTKEETRFFVEALVKCNLKSLADVSERLASQHHTELLERT